MRALALALLFGWLVGCAGAQDARAPEVTAPEVIAPSVSPSALVMRHTDPTARFEVHEWGLIQVERDGATRLSAGPAPRRPATVPPTEGAEEDGAYLADKPVLYVHVDPDTPPFPLRVRAQLRAGRITEHWPPAELDAGGVSWSVLVSPCSAEVDWPTGAECDLRVDPVCERAELRAYGTSDAACLETSSGLARLLFYRGGMSSPRLPLSVEREGASLRVRGVPPSVVLYTRGRRGGIVSWAEGETLAPIPEGEGALDGDGLNAALAEALRRGGLTEPEVDAFLRAWSEELFDQSWALVRRDILLHPPPPSLVYVLPESLVDELVPLEIEPAPRTLRRVFVVRVLLPAAVPLVRRTRRGSSRRWP
jgi:hypothetical protein